MKNLSYFVGKHIYIYPYSDLSKVLALELEAQGVRVLGFISTYKQENTISLEDVRSFDFILIFSPNNEEEIYKNTIKNIPKEKIFCTKIEKNMQYNFFQKPAYKIKKTMQFKKKPLKNEILFIGLQFIDLNLKYLYLYLKKHTDIKLYLSTANQRDCDFYNSIGMPCMMCGTEEFINIASKTKVKIIDQTPTTPYILEALSIGYSVQLWHGITIEQLGVLANYKLLTYDMVLSTSKFVTEYSFSKIYDYKKIIHCGYPRNDILHFENVELINVDLELLKSVKKKKYKYIIYAPTHRSNSFKDNPISYKKLNDFAIKQDIKFIIKMHPLVYEKFRDDLSFYQGTKQEFTNIIIYPPNMDIYPIMKYCDLMIADYSSIYFDFLFVDKPIVFFPYDYDEWVRSEGGVVLDYFAHSPGDKAYDFDELLELILKNLEQDMYKNERKKIKDKMFSNQKKQASECIAKYIQRLFDV